MFQKHTENGYIEAVPGVGRKTLVYGEKTLLGKFLLKKGSHLPGHSHPHEQTGYLVKGHMNFTVGKEKYVVMPGDSWCIPGDVEHAVEAIEDSLVIEVFSPVREDFLPEEKE